jgi:dipeptidyl aminopeptidase/acylaminoacyl peptidase
MSSLPSTTVIPRRILFGSPEKIGAALSPDGKRLMYRAPVNDVLNIFVGTVGADDFEPITHETERNISAALWAWDNRHILYVRDKAGDENFHLFKVDVDSGETVDLTPFENVQVFPQDVDKAFPDEALFTMNKDNPMLKDVYRVVLSTGEVTKVAENPGDVFIWVNDADFKVRGAVTMRPDGGWTVRVRDTEDSEWREVFTSAQEDGQTSVSGFSKDGSKLRLTTAKDANAERLIEIDLATGEQKVIAEDPTYDVGGVAVDPDTHEIQAVTFIKDRQEKIILDDSIREDYAAISQLHPGDWGITSRDASNRVWLVAFTADDGPVEYWTYDRDSKQGTFLFNHQPALAEYDLSKIEPFEFQARDGLTVHGYLTFPQGVERRDLPTVLCVHGGPWARDMWGYNPTAQWLANRGYLCVQVNYRGSTGYGKEFLNAGDKQWGKTMHTDLVDAVDFVVEKGWADKERIGIYGGSYGGYAALAGVTFTPELFACSVDIVGPSNLHTLLESIPPYWAPMKAIFTKRMGDPETEADLLTQASPLTHVDKICRPLLIAQGANDPRVKQAESEQIVEAMKEKGIPHEYLLYPDEGHGFQQPENNLHFHAVAERFLARHLGGRCEEEDPTLAALDRTRSRID